MEKKVASGIMLTLLLISMLALTINIQRANAEPDTIYIHYDVIPSTAPIHRDGDIYTFTDNIYDSIVVFRDNIVIDGGGYTLQGPGFQGIVLSDRINVTIRNVSIKGFTKGIICARVVGSSSGNRIFRNRIQDNSFGIYLSESSGNNITENDITSNYDGIHIYPHSNYNSIAGNNITANRHYGICQEYATFHNSIYGNSISNNYCGIYFKESMYNVIFENNVTTNSMGLSLSESDDSLIFRNCIAANMMYGIHLYDSDGNKIYQNNITENNGGVYVYYSLSTVVHHNNFISNIIYHIKILSARPVLDDGYPSGGNYWSDYAGIDEKSGPNQDQSGSDGIGDTPYIVDSRNQDNYPLMEPSTPTPPTIIASVDIDPDTLNLRSKGKWITACIQLPEEYGPEDINASTILLNGTISPILNPKYDFVTNSSEYLVDYDNDGVLERMVKFDRAAVGSFVCSQGIRYGDVSLTVTGTLFDETPFEATGTVELLFPGDADGDGDVDFNDFIIFAGCYGTNTDNSRYVPRADFNEDQTIDYNDFITFADNYGKTAI